MAATKTREKINKTSHPPKLESFIADLRYLSTLPKSRKFNALQLADYPFDLELLTSSRLYRKSREHYLALGGQYSARVSSTMRSLSAQDLFKDEIDFTPSSAEMIWFKDHFAEVANPVEEVDALIRFNEISLFHEQNHRIVWRLLPPAPKDERGLSRYLNFAEALVVTLDLALGDELGHKTSTVFERTRIIYRTGGRASKLIKSKNMERKYLLALFCATYLVLETVNSEDIFKALNYILPEQKDLNRDAVRRSLDINELFTRVTNPQWQEANWRHARKSLRKLHHGSLLVPLTLPKNPLDFDLELDCARNVFSYFGL
jgi:hypothetical protein